MIGPDTCISASAMDRHLLLPAMAVAVILAVLLVPLARAEDNSWEGCLRRDSISCVQQHVYRKMRAVFGQDTISLLGGFQLAKTEAGRRSLEDNLIDEDALENTSVQERQEALEDYAVQRITNFFNERTWTWSLTPAIEQVVSTARMAAASVPVDIRDKLSNYVFEGRGKKKMIKMLGPLMSYVRLKMELLAAVSYAAVTVVVKKALIVSVLALALSLYLTVKKLLLKYHHPIYHGHHSIEHKSSQISPADRSSWGAGWSAWDSYEPHAAHSQASHHMAYTPQKPTRR